MGAAIQVREAESVRHNPLLLPAEAGFAPAEIPGLRKAAILMVALGDELAKTLFLSLSEADVRRVTEEITRLGEIPAQQLTQVMTEFYGLLETQQYMVRGGPEYALKLLTEAFGLSKAEDLLAQVKKIRERTNGDMAMLQKMDPQHLSKFLETEHPQTIALVLAHLDAKRGSAVLMSLHGQIRVEVVRRLAEMRQFSPEMAQTVALVLHKRMEGAGSSGRKSYSGFKAVAELLNRLDQLESKGILEEIEHDEPQLAIGIRNLMFTFEDLVTVPPESIREFVAAADKKVLALALKGARDNVKSHLFKAMSSRAIEMLKEDMEVMGPVRLKEVNHAQQELLALARQLESEGRMILKMEVDDDLAI
ncbi:flagellar motor switch protein FliG [Edaphobacter dinghuensis]|uniref:Flagellar motor switch protein FliG n=1 Tax=Edaphobacter dinghuensis TaxID=1560005 RepID=A0A917HJH4_9BACT|nr:flagellar motor switch protein FliG [Edaphobacter dinghuensis]GGG81640.1 flagellar motor switch protein FliG [Edaphobacter dinghuensis]